MGADLPFVHVSLEPFPDGPRKNGLDRFEHTYKSEVTRIHPLTEMETLYEIQLLDPAERERFTFLPGQFLMLEVPGIGEAPFSIASSPLRHGAVELCIRRAGNLTNFLARVERGTRVGIRGPFGTHFPLEGMHGQDILLVAGGLGLAPLRSAIACVQENRSRFGSVDIVYGAKNPSSLLFTYLYDLWRQDDMRLDITVEEPDGSWDGSTGLITGKLEEVVSLRDPGTLREGTCAVVCGPPVMFRHVCGLLTRHGIPMQKMFVSLERRMHCGVGKCCRCNVGSTYTCTRGPVFDYWTVMNLNEAI